MAHARTFGELERLPVERLVARHGRVDVRPQLLVRAARVHVDQVAGSSDHLGGEKVGHLLGERAIRFAREHAVQILAIHRTERDAAAEESRQVGDLDENQRAPQSAGVGCGAQALQGEDGGKLIAVNSGRQRQHGSRIGPVDDRDGQLGFAHGDRHRLCLAGWNAVGGEFKWFTGEGSQTGEE